MFDRHEDEIKLGNVSNTTRLALVLSNVAKCGDGK